ncbi:LysR family transcriptional regulator [Moraxella canis]|uniref:LysR family transcriptional regulator n=1 Tax=Moraxella canis TaxID=90239 RepID=UPI000668D282|nr:LysR family transcriptional regulator [Moraxella canis]
MNPANITLRQLRAFRAVAETGSFTKAAENLHLTQSALSGLVKELEANLDLRLFDRTTRSLSLSATGKYIYPMVNRVLYDLETMATEVSRLKALENGVVKVAVSQQLAAAILPKVMAGFAAEYPNIRVSMLDTSVEGVIELVNTGEVDFGIGPERKVGDGISSELLFDLPFHIVISPSHPFSSQDSVRWCQLENETLIALAGSFSELLAADLPKTEAKYIQGAAYKVNFMTTAFSMVSENLGVTLCLPYSRQRVHQNGLQMRLLTEPLVTRASYIYRQRGRNLSEAAYKFYTELCKNLQEYDY